MTRKLLTALFTILSIAGYAQIKYDSAYFVTNDGKRINCLIKNTDWFFNPTEFFYKQGENGPIEKATIAEVREFGVLNFSRYERFEVDVDTSTDQTDHINTNSRPEYKRETIFLKVLVQGKATLYEYRAQNMIRYYFKTDSINLRPLIHKIYLTSYDQNGILENNLFRNQLFAALQSPELDESRFQHLGYSENSLTAIFDVYNRNGHSRSENFVLKQSKSQFHLNLRAGADLSGLTMNEKYTTPAPTPYGNKINVTVGLEAEDVLPFNRNKWAIVLQPSYHYYKSVLPAGGSADYKLIETGLGGREYFFIAKDSKLFATALMLFDEPIGSGTVVYQGYTLGYWVRFNAALGVGYKYKNKCSIEVQYTLPRNILDSYYYIQGKLNTTSLVFAYSIL